MKAAIFREYGPPENVTVEEVPKPVPGERDILIRVHATTMGAADSAFRQGVPRAARLFAGIRRPKVNTLGSELAGDVEAIGALVTRFRVGDKIFGATGAKFGSHAEYALLDQDEAIVPLPDGLSYEDAVAAVDGVLTALPFLRDHAHLTARQSILINGASGCVGIAAVQLAKYFGADVTAVCSAANRELVLSVGADHVIDYAEEDFTTSGKTFDVIFDAVGKSSFLRARSSLNPGGMYMSTAASPALLVQMPWTARFGRKKAAVAFTGLRKPSEKQKDLELLLDLLKRGVIVPVIEKTYPLDEIVEAHRHVDTGRKKGNVVIAVAQAA